MKMFEFLDNLHVNTELMNRFNEKPPKKNCMIDVKEYKKQYYQNNIEIYRKRNKEYREKKKLEKKI